MDLTKKSRDFAPIENIRPQILSGDLGAGDVLNSGPPLGIENVTDQFKVYHDN